MLDFEPMNGPVSGWADAHSHLADPRIENAGALLVEARAQGIQFFLQGGLGPEDWQRQLELASREPGVWPVFGLHPYWVADHSDNDCEAALDQLARVMGKASALGETGLDFRPSIVKDSKSRQISCFEAQLEMAKVAHKPVVLHIVRAFDEALQILDLFGHQTTGFVHSFAGAWPQAKEYLDRGYLISVGGPLCRPGLKRLHQAVRQIPLDRLLIETDSPDQPPPGINLAENRPSTLLFVAERVAEIKGLTREQILDKTCENLRKLLNQPSS